MHNNGQPQVNNEIKEESKDTLKQTKMRTQQLKIYTTKSIQQKQFLKKNEKQSPK